MKIEEDMDCFQQLLAAGLFTPEAVAKANTLHNHLNAHKPLRLPEAKPGSKSTFSLTTDRATNMVAALIQMTGPEAAKPCSRCIKKGAGAWLLCIRPPCELIDKHVNGACGNCAYRARAADCSDSRKWKLAEKSGMVAKGDIKECLTKWADEADEIAPILGTPEGHRRFLTLAANIRRGPFDFSDKPASTQPPCGIPLLDKAQ